LCTAEASVACLLGLDLLWDFLADDQRQRVLDVLRQRMLRNYQESVEGDVWWYHAVNHWNAVINSAAGMAALAMGEGDEEAAGVGQLARTGLERFFDALGKEGGWDEGIGYWGYAIRSVLLFGHACARLDDDQSVLHHRGMAQTAEFPLYFSPNGRTASFGDSGRLPLHGTLYLLETYYDRKDITWWLDTYSMTHDASTTDWSKAGLSLLLREDDGEVAPPQLDTVKVFDRIGWGTLADHWPRPGFYTALKTGDLATSHAQRDMNSIQLQVDGESLLVDLGHPPDEGSAYFSGQRSDFYEVQARAHNTLIVGGEDHRPDAIGRIIDSGQQHGRRWMTGQAGEACGDSVRYYRHVIMILDGGGNGQSLLVVDEVDLALPEKVEWFWHTSGQLQIDAASGIGTIEGRRASLNLAVAGTVELQIDVESRMLEYRRADRFVHITAGGIDTLYLASLFSRRTIRKRPELNIQSDGGLSVTIAGQDHLFSSGDGHLNYTP
jgi:hypothetical protein